MIALAAAPLLVLLSTQPTPLAPVAGDYYQGDGLGANSSLTLEREGRFHFSERGCLGLYAAFAGRAVLQDGVVTLEPDRPPTGELETRVPLVLRVVRWGKRIYLIPPDDIPDFENAVNLAREPRRGVHGSFYLRHGDVEALHEDDRFGDLSVTAHLGDGDVLDVAARSLIEGPLDVHLDPFGEDARRER